jgi:hypothetical protein
MRAMLVSLLLCGCATSPATGAAPESDQDQTMDVIRAHRKALQQCADDQRLRDPASNGTGKVLLEWTVDVSGAATNVHAASDGPAEFIDCLAAEVRTCQFGTRASPSAPVQFPFKY